MFLGYRMKKRSMAAYNRIIVPEISGYQPIPEEPAAPAPAGRHRLKGVLRAAACMVLAFLMISLIVSRNNQGPGAFTLTAYAAAPQGDSSDNSGALKTYSFDVLSGVTISKYAKTTLPIAKIYVTKGADGVNYGSNIEDFNDIIVGTKSVILSSGFKFTGDKIDTVTMTAQKGRIVAYDISKTAPITTKYARIINHGNTVECVSSDDQLTNAEKEVLKSLIKSGTTITFSPAGMTAFWDYTFDAAQKTADTLTITVKYQNGTTQTSVVSISEEDNGVVLAELR